MPIITVLIVLVVVGVIVWLLMRAPFIDATFKQIILWVAVAFVVLWLLRVFFGGSLDSVRI